MSKTSNPATLLLLECKGRTVFLRRFLAKPGSWTQQHAPFLVSLWNFSSPLRRKTHQIQCRGPENGTASYKRAKKKTHFIFKANKTFFYDEYHIYHKTVTLYTLQISKQMKVQLFFYSLVEEHNASHRIIQGPFLERPGNFTGPKAHFETKNCWIVTVADLGEAPLYS